MVLTTLFLCATASFVSDLFAFFSSFFVILKYYSIFFYIFLLPSRHVQHRLSKPVTPKIPLGLAKPIELLNHSPLGDLVTSSGYRIVNGSDATVNQFPWFVSVRAYTPRGLQSICGGSLIAKTWVLTAGHCTHGYSTFNLGLGSRNLNKPFISLTSDNVIEHARYNPNNLNNDVSLIGLPKSMVFTAFVQAIRLPTLRQAITGRYHTEKARVCGFGRTTDGKFSRFVKVCGLIKLTAIKKMRFSSVVQAGSGGVSPLLKWVDKRIITNRQCTQTFGSKVVIPSTMCGIGWEFDGQSTCNGDSGILSYLLEIKLFSQTQIHSPKKKT